MGNEALGTEGRQMNTVSMSGRLTRDPNLKHACDREICEMRIAVDNRRHPTTYIDATAFDGQAYACAEFLAKGRLVGVEGRLALDEWRGEDGRRRQRYVVIGRVEFLDRPPGKEAPEDPIGSTAPETEPELSLAAVG
jgi:single-strand DNA-binding protein